MVSDISFEKGEIMPTDAATPASGYFFEYIEFIKYLYLGCNTIDVVSMHVFWPQIYFNSFQSLQAMYQNLNASISCANTLRPQFVQGNLKDRC